MYIFCRQNDNPQFLSIKLGFVERFFFCINKYLNLKLINLVMRFLGSKEMGQSTTTKLTLTNVNCQVRVGN